MNRFNSAQQRLLTIIFPTLFSLLSFISCTKPPGNGRLDGQWQVMDITNNVDGTLVKPKQMYYAFEQKLVNLRQVGYYQHTGNMRYANDSIHINAPYIHATTANRFGMDSTSCVFRVDELTKETLRMHGKKYTLRCRRF